MSKLDAADWSSCNHDSRGWRNNAAESKLTPTSVADLTLKWRFPVDDASDRTIGIVRCLPSIVNGYADFGTTTRSTFCKLTPDGKIAGAVHVGGGFSWGAFPLWLFEIDRGHSGYVQQLYQNFMVSCQAVYRTGD